MTDTPRARRAVDDDEDEDDQPDESRARFDELMAEAEKRGGTKHGEVIGDYIENRWLS